MKRILLLIIIFLSLFLLISCCNQPKEKPKFKDGTIVTIILDNRKGMILQHFPSGCEGKWKYYVKIYLNNKYIQDYFYEYELKENLNLEE